MASVETLVRILYLLITFESFYYQLIVLGHKTKECPGAQHGGAGEHGATDTSYKPKFILVKLNVLRRHIEQELRMSNFPFTFDPKRAIDDWVFLYFFLGNDFLPPLFSLEKGKEAMDRLFELYKTVVLKAKVIPLYYLLFCLKIFCLFNRFYFMIRAG